MWSVPCCGECLESPSNRRVNSAMRLWCFRDSWWYAATMMTQTDALHELLDPVGDCLTPEGARKLANLHASAPVQKRMEELAGKSTAGTLTEAERSEYESLVSAGTFIAILQSKARMLLRDSNGSG